jgi:hypothetical protein
MILRKGLNLLKKRRRKSYQMYRKHQVCVLILILKDLPAPGASLGGPRLIIINGVVTVDTSSLHVLQETPEIDDDAEATVVMEEKSGRHLTSSSFGKNKKRVKWTTTAIDLLYEVC